MRQTYAIKAKDGRWKSHSRDEQPESLARALVLVLRLRAIWPKQAPRWWSLICIPAMLASRGAIVNMASILGSRGFANSSTYVADEHAVVGMTKSTAMEYRQKTIRINAIGPAFIDTPLLSEFDQTTRDWLISKHQIGRMGTCQEVLALTLFLLSDQASFITGSYHLINGGYTAP